MLRYKTETRRGLVALYDIRPGNRGSILTTPEGDAYTVQGGLAPLLKCVGDCQARVISWRSKCALGCEIAS